VGGGGGGGGGEGGGWGWQCALVRKYIMPTSYRPVDFFREQSTGAATGFCSSAPGCVDPQLLRERPPAIACLPLQPYITLVLDNRA
jgi:hypothetical protein